MAPSPPRKAARAAFDKLDTQEKSAFIFEATFSTIGQALEETGRRVSEVVESFDLDDLFTAPPADEPAPRKAAPKKPAARKASTKKKTAPRAKTPPPPSKTAGKPKTGDDAA